MIADMMFAWARERGAIDFSHWFFPMRGGGGDFRKGEKTTRHRKCGCSVEDPVRVDLNAV